MKYCSTCAQFKPDKKFHKWESGPGGLAYTCQDCRAIYMREYYRKNKDKYKKYYQDKIFIDINTLV
jgi:hypothetical protein